MKVYKILLFFLFIEKFSESVFIIPDLFTSFYTGVYFNANFIIHTRILLQKKSPILGSLTAGRLPVCATGARREMSEMT